MQKRFALRRRATASATAFGFLLSTVVPMLLMTSQASAAAQMSFRQIAIGSSKVSATDVTYSVSFRVATTGVIQGIVVDLCDATAAQGPLIGTVCTAPAGLNTNKATLALANQSGISGFAIDTTNSTNNKVILTNASGASVSAGTTVSFDLGSTGASDGFTNPSANGTFYGRLLTYATPAGATSYNSTTTNANNPGSYVDNGGVALSTANQLSTNARVQEQLEFCVAATEGTGGTSPVTADAETPTNCADAKMTTSTTVDLGVIDSGGASVSPVTAATGGNNRNGGFLIRTNAANGATVSYKAEQDASTGTNKGSLKVATANCVSSVSVQDQCFNSAGATKTAFTSAGERFGVIMAAKYKNQANTNNLTSFGQYAGTGTAADGFTWEDDGAVHKLADTANTVVDYEFGLLKFAARAATTTPTGSYAVTSTYIATSTF